MKRSTGASILLLWLICAACSSPTPAPPTQLGTTALPGGGSATAPAVTASAAPAGDTVAPPTPGPTAAPATQSAATATASAATATPARVATSTANPTVAGGLVGMWQGNNNSFYLLNKDGTWSWDQKLQQVLTTPENQGRWWVEGDIFRIQDVSGKAPCPPNQIGSYQVRLSGDTLVLVAVADLCSPRIDQTAGTYARQPAGP